MESKSKSLVIIIPAYNEEKIIEKTIKSVFKELRTIKLKPTLLIVDDGSTDQTNRIIKKQILKKHKLEIVKHKINTGYGSAVQTGIKFAIKNNFKYALFMDSDLTNDPKDIKKFVNEIRYDYDCIKASRYIKTGKVKNIPKKRFYVSKIGNIIASNLFNVGVYDCTNGFLMIKSCLFKNITLKEKGFSIIMEEMYILKKKNASFKEVPVTLTNRATGKSNFKYSLITFYNYLKYPIKSLWI